MWCRFDGGFWQRGLNLRWSAVRARADANIAEFTDRLEDSWHRTGHRRTLCLVQGRSAGQRGQRRPQREGAPDAGCAPRRDHHLQFLTPQSHRHRKLPQRLGLSNRENCGHRRGGPAHPWRQGTRSRSARLASSSGVSFRRGATSGRRLRLLQLPAAGPDAPVRFRPGRRALRTPPPPPTHSSGGLVSMLGPSLSRIIGSQQPPSLQSTVITSPPQQTPELQSDHDRRCHGRATAVRDINRTVVR